MVVITIVRWGDVHQLITSTGASHCKNQTGCFLYLPDHLVVIFEVAGQTNGTARTESLCVDPAILHAGHGPDTDD